MTSVLFVCLGNICRSPTAQGILLKKLEEHGLSEQITVDSCGTGAWHIGQPPDERMIEAAASYGYDLSALRARRIEANDFNRFQYILAMDARNLADVIKQLPNDFSGEIRLFLDYLDGHTVTEVPDPYYGGDDGFQQVCSLIELACDGLLTEIKKHA